MTTVLIVAGLVIAVLVLDFLAGLYVGWHHKNDAIGRDFYQKGLAAQPSPQRPRRGWL